MKRIKHVLSTITFWVTLPIWIIPFIVIYLFVDNKHEEDYLK